jgi:hypothetical protein
MSQAKIEGFAKGELKERNYPSVGDGAPLLNGFYFRYDIRGQADTTDNHLNSLMVLPGGNSTDLTPNAQNQPARVPDGKIQFMLRDADPTAAEDEYFFTLGHSILRDGLAGRRVQLRDVGQAGEIRRDLPGSIFQGPGDKVLGLAGFKLFYTGGRDHHVDEIEVTFINDDRTLRVRLNDRDNNDVFGYLVDIVVLSRSPAVTISTGVSSGSAKGGDRVALPSGPSHSEWGIRGFRFDYPSGDRHLREVGIVKRGSDLEVFYGDDSGDLEFDWRVNWMYVGPPVAAPT